MVAIYEPKGAAKEYAELACNLYGDADGKVGGCQHGCKYCYCPQFLHIPAERFYCIPKPKPRIIESLERAANKMMANGDKRRVAFGFIGDPYCQVEMDYGVTRQALQVMVDRGVLFEIITKGGTRAVRDFDLLKQGGRLGISLVWDDSFKAIEWEPDAAGIDDRVIALWNAHNEGIYTWVSVEPVIEPQEALNAIRWVTKATDEFRVGKINHCKELEQRVDWQKFTDEAYELLLQTGRAFMFKDSLHPYLQGRPAKVGYE